MNWDTDPDDGSIVLVTRRTKKMSWRRHKRWLWGRVQEAMPTKPLLHGWLYRAACARAKHLRNWFGA